MISSHDIPSDFQIIKKLGSGGEGTVYLTIYRSDSKPYAMKRFHTPLPKAWAVGLQVYAAQVGLNDHGLLPIQLWETEEGIQGVYYPYTKLHRLHRHLVSRSKLTAQALVGSYCNMQHYLMSNYGIGLLEPSADHLMVSQDGKFFYIDFGYGISTLHHSETSRLNLFGYGFAAFLPSLFGQNLRAIMQPVPGHQLDQSCIYFADPLFDTLSVEHEWIAPIISEVRSSPASMLLDAEFYNRIGACLPHRLASPLSAMGVSNLLYGIGALHRRVRWFVNK